MTSRDTENTVSIEPGPDATQAHVSNSWLHAQLPEPYDPDPAKPPVTSGKLLPSAPIAGTLVCGGSGSQRVRHPRRAALQDARIP